MQKYGTLSDMLKRDRTIQDCYIDGKCSNCGGCCNDIIPLTNADINRIKIYIKENNIKPINHTLKCLSLASYDAVCPFRDEQNKKCIIYPVRPAICRCFNCHDYYSKFNKNHDKFKNVKPISCRETFFN